jgi:hypothetical protein
MKTIGWLAGVGTLVASGAYMVVSLNRWEWNRALFYGLILLIAEVALATGLVLKKLGQLSGAPAVDPEIAAAVRDSAPDPSARFKWLDDTTSGQLSVFITFAVAGGVLLSGIAWLVDRIASKTTSRVGERHLINRLHAISYPAGGLMADGDDVRLRRLLGPVAH